MSVAEDFAGRTPVVQEAWGKLESEFLEKAAGVESEAGALFSAGDADGANALLTQFMRDNLAETLSRLRELQTQFNKGG
jgi:hypothetical protein